MTSNMKFIYICVLMYSTLVKGGTLTRQNRMLQRHSFIPAKENTPIVADPDIERLINRQYLMEFFEPLTDELPRHVTFLLDQDSFLRGSVKPSVLESFPGLINFNFNDHIQQKQDIFYPVYMEEIAQEQRFKPHLTESDDGFLTVESEKLLEMLNNVLTFPRNYRMSAVYRSGSSDYISEKLGRMGLVLGLQSFMPLKFNEQFDGYDPKQRLETLPTGMNMFAIYPGELWGTPEDRLIIIGSHWDTVDSTDGYNDNGSGVATLLELARVIVESRCKPKNSIIFVAFDLEEMGAQGSQEFVNMYLIPSILRKFNQTDITGAFIVDTMMAFNQTKGSQLVPDSWKALDPETMQSIEDDDATGDFLAIVERRGLDAELSQVFQRHWNHLQAKIPENAKYKTREFRVNATKETPTLDELVDMMPFVRSDHIRFWVINETDFTSFPSVLFTDTGPQRIGMSSCYHRPCDSVRPPYNAPFVEMEFFRHTVQALLNTVLELSRANCLPSETPVTENEDTTTSLINEEF